MIVCVNKSSKEFKDLLKETRMHPIVLAAKINEWQDLNKTDRFPTKEQVVLGKNITKENVPLHDLDGQTRLLYSLNAPETQNKSIIDTQYEKVLRDRIDEFLSKMGFKIDSRGSFTDINGNPIDARAMVDFLNKIVSIAEGNSDISDLTEETIHIVVRLLQQSNDPLYKAMLDQIESMSEYAETLQNYSNVAGYDDAKLHEEAIGKAIKNIIINRKHEEENALPVYKSWFQKLVDWFKSLGKKIKDDPFIRTAQMFMNDEFAKYTEATGTDKMYAKIPQTQEDAVKLFDHTNNTLVKKIVNVKDFVSKGYKGVRDELERYYDTVNGVIVPNRITDKPQEIRDAKKSKSRIIKEQDSPSALLFKKLGTRLHATMELLGPAVLNNTSLEGAQTQSQLNSRDFAKLVKFTKSMISEAETIQNRIDPKGKIAWRFEQKIYSLAENEGGTIDVMAVYSNGTSASTWEYKFKHTSGYNSTIDQLTRQRVFTRDVMDDEAIYAGDIQMSRQKNILAQNYGITDLRTSRLVPFAITVPYKEGVPEDKITELFSPIDGSEYLTVLALGDESTGIEALDNKLKVIDKRIINLKAALIDAVLPVHKEKLRSMIHDLRKVQLKIHTEYDISLILDLAYSAAKPALGTTEKKFEDGKLLHSNEEYINGKPNPQYMSLKELQDLMDELTAYSSILEESAIYAVAVGDKELLSPDRIANIKRRTSITKDLVDNTIGFIKVKMEERLFGDANSQGIDLNPKTRPVRQLTWAQLNLNRLSEIDHPVFEYARSLLFKADGAKRAQVLQTAKEIEELEKELFAYADSIGVSHMKIYDKYIEKDGFYIKSMYKDELYQDLLPKHRLANNAAWIKERFDVREDYMNKYNDKFDSQKKKIWDMWRDVETQPDVWTRNGDIRTKLLEQWVDRNDYRKSPL